VYDSKYFLGMITAGKARYPSGIYERSIEQRLLKNLN